MMNQRAIDGLKPANPSFPGARLASKGYSILDIFTLNKRTDSRWLYVTFESFYGVFGFMNVRPPGWITWSAWLLILVSVALTITIEMREWSQNRSLLKFAFLFGPAAILINLLASLYYSWTINYQAQGRFLFPILPALTLLVFGISPAKPANRKLEIVRTGTQVILYGVALVFYAAVLQNDYLYKLPS